MFGGMLSVGELFFGISVFLVAFLIINKITRSRRFNIPPGPRGLPLLGNVMMLGNNPHLTLTKLKGEYGRIYSMKFGSLRAVVLNDYDLLKEMMIEKGRDFSGRVSVLTANIMSRQGTDIAFSDYSNLWREKKKLCMAGLKMAERNRWEIAIHEERLSLMEKFKSMESSEGFDPELIFALAITNVTCSIAFNTKYKQTDEEFLNISQVHRDMFLEMKQGNPVDYLPWLQLFPNKQIKALKGLIRQRDFYINSKFQEHVDTFDEHDVRDITDALLLNRKRLIENGNPIGKQLTDSDIQMILGDIMIGGTETSTTVILWFCVYVINYPEEQRKIQKEIDSVVGRNRLPVLSDRDKLPYLEAAIWETLRLAVIAPVTIPHKSVIDTALGGYSIPAETMIMNNMWAIQRNPEVFAQPNDFRPARFVDSSGQCIHPTQMGFLPFAAGPRKCPGDSLARVELFLLISTIMQQFTLHAPNGVSRLPMEGEFGLSLTPKPYKLILKTR